MAIKILKILFKVLNFMDSWKYLFSIVNIMIIFTMFVSNRNGIEFFQFILLTMNFLISFIYISCVVLMTLYLEFSNNTKFEKENNKLKITKFKNNNFVKLEECYYYFLKELDNISYQLLIPLIILLGVEKHTAIKWFSIGLCIIICINKLLLLKKDKRVPVLFEDTIMTFKESKSTNKFYLLYRLFTSLIKFIQSCIEWLAVPKRLCIIFWSEILLIVLLSISFIISIFSVKSMILNIIILIPVLFIFALFISHNKYVNLSLQEELVDLLTNPVDLPENKTNDLVDKEFESDER